VKAGQARKATFWAGRVGVVADGLARIVCGAFGALGIVLVVALRKHVKRIVPRLVCEGLLAVPDGIGRFPVQQVAFAFMLLVALFLALLLDGCGFDALRTFGPDDDPIQG